MNFNQYFREVWCWLAEGKIAIMCLLVIIASISLGWFTWQSEFSIRLTGYFLQLIGMTFAIKGLLGIREYFNQANLKCLFTNWFKNFPKWKKICILNPVCIHNESAIMKPRVESWFPDNVDFTVEQRINCIIKNLDIIQNEQHKHSHSIEMLKDNHDKHKKEGVERSEKIQKELHSKLESLHTTDLIESLVGLIFLTIGMTMSTMAPELNDWLH